MPLSFQIHFFSTCITFLVSVCVGMITRKHLSSTPTPPTSLTCGRRKCCRTQRIRGKRRGSRRYNSLYKYLSKIMTSFNVQLQIILVRFRDSVCLQVGHLFRIIRINNQNYYQVIFYHSYIILLLVYKKTHSKGHKQPLKWHQEVDFDKTKWPKCSLYLSVLGAEALCGWDATEGGEEGPKGEEPSAGVEHDGSGQRAKAGPSTHHTPRQRGFL